MLKKGDKIGVVAPSGPHRKYSLDELRETITSYGFEVEFGESCKGSYMGYLSSEDEVRANDIEYMFSNKEIDAIFCIRGGYGTPRILDMIDYDIIKKNPKIFIGYSDITALHIAIIQNANLITFHGPMVGTMPDWDEFTINSVFETLNVKENLDILNPEDEEIQTIVKGICEGELVGGNLALLASTMGTDYEIDTKGKILFIEDIGEEIYRLDRMLTQLALGNKFKDCAGIIFGDFCDCNKEHDDDFELEQLIIDRVAKYNKPTIYNLKSGHCTPMITLALGANYTLDATKKTLTLNMKKAKGRKSCQYLDPRG